jgi:hypothetical protein
LLFCPRDTQKYQATNLQKTFAPQLDDPRASRSIPGYFGSARHYVQPPSTTSAFVGKKRDVHRSTATARLTRNNPPKPSGINESATNP